MKKHLLPILFLLFNILFSATLCAAEKTLPPEIQSLIVEKVGEKKPNVMLFDGRRIKIISADDKGFIAEADGGKIPLEWRALDPAALHQLLKALPGSETIRLVWAAHLWDLGFEPEAGTVLNDEYLGGNTSGVKAFLAERWKLEENPDALKVEYVDPFWVLSDKKGEIEKAQTAAKNFINAKSAKEAEAAGQTLKTLCEKEPALCACVLRIERRKQLEALFGDSLLGNPKHKAFKVFQEDLGAARSKALALIHNEEKYNPENKEAQKDVDKLVAALQDIWKAPLSHVCKNSDALKDWRKKIETCDVFFRENKIQFPAGCDLESPADALNARFFRLALASAPKKEAELNKANAKIIARILETKEKTLEAKEIELIQITNEYRWIFGLPALSIHSTVCEMAQGHSEFQAKMEKMAHDLKGEPTGNKFPDRVKHYKLDKARCGENVAFGFPDAGMVFDGWLHSSGHHRAILTAEYLSIGIGYAVSEKKVPYWTQNFYGKTN